MPPVFGSPGLAYAFVGGCAMIFSGLREEQVSLRRVTLHCFNPNANGLWTVCGRQYEGIMYAHWPAGFHDGYEEVDLCKDCLDHPDYPLIRLGDLP